MTKVSWGKRVAKILGLKAWNDHDGTQTWSDGGDARDLLVRLHNEFGESIEREIAAVIAANVKLAMAEYAATAVYSLAVRDKMLWVEATVGNPQAKLTFAVPLRDLLNDAIRDAYEGIGANSSSQEFMSHIAGLARDLNKMVPQGNAPGQYVGPGLAPGTIAQRQRIGTGGV